MKLSMQQHVELNKMTQHFHQIEEIAERMGVEVDTFADEFKEHNAFQISVRKNLSAKRHQIFREAGNNNSQQSSKSNLTAIVNEERFRN